VSFLSNLKRDALNSLRGLEPQNLAQAFIHPGRTLEGIGDFYGQFAQHPIRTFENQPVSTALGFVPGVGPLAKLAKLRMAAETGDLSLLGEGAANGGLQDLMRSVNPVDSSFADVMQTPSTSWSLPSENGFGIANQAPTSAIQSAIARGPQFSTDLLDSEARSSLLPEGPQPLNPNDAVNSPYDVYNHFNADWEAYLNPDQPDLGMLFNQHVDAIPPESEQYQAFLDDMPEAHGEYPAGPDYANMGPEDFQALGLNGEMPPELQQFLGEYRPRLQDIGPMNRSMGTAVGLTGSAGAGIPQLLRSMMADAQPSVQQRLLSMLMQKFSQQ
jgi:hypothetical protein